MRLLVDDNELEVVATARGANRLYFEEGYKFMSMDISDAANVKEVITSEKPDVVINTAAMTNVDQCELEQDACWVANVDAVQHIVDACELSGSFLLHLSTDFIFDGTKGPLSEDEKPNPVSHYGESKLAAERILMNSKLDWAIARTILVYGIVPKMSRSNIILWVKNSVEAGKEIKVVNDQWRTPTLAEDLAMGCYLIAKQKAMGVFNISGKDLLTPYEMAQKVVAYFDLDGSLITEADSSTFSQPAKRPPRTGFIIDKAREVLGYGPKSFDEGIAILANQLEA